MKRVFYLCVTCFAILTSCKDILLNELQESNKTLEESIQDNTSRIERLEALCKEMNTNITSLHTIVEALQKNDHITSVTPVTENGKTVGYTISFIHSGTITIYNGKDGEDAHTPQIGIRQDTDGNYYWTLDGEWMLDSAGNKIKGEGKDGMTPQLRINGGYWEISYDGGSSWTQMDKATGDNGNSFFSDVILTDTDVTFTLADGTELTIPFHKEIGIEFTIQGDETGAAAGKEIMIGYTLENASESAVVSASSDGNYAVKVLRDNVSSGTLVITCPDVYTDGYINFIVTDASGYSALRVINFYESQIIFENGMEYQIAAEGGQITVPFSVNFNYTAVISPEASSWLALVPGTKAETRHEQITVSASLNDGFSARSGKILIYAETNSETPFTEIIINQASAYFSIDQSNYAIPYIGETIVTHITSSLGLSLSIPEGDNWISSSITENNGNDYAVTTTVAQNRTSSERNSEILLYNADKSILIGSIKIVQLCENIDDPNDMIFVTRANYVNDFTAYLPISGDLDCYIDWGDGDVEYINDYIQTGEKWISHKYNIFTPTSYDIRISGTVTVLNSENIPINTVTEVKQWGKTGLKSVNYAFSHNGILSKIAEDKIGAFENIIIFDYAFYYCKSLMNIPENLFQFCTSTESFNSTFQFSNLAEIPENLFENCTKVLSFNGTFSNCKLESIPEKLFHNCYKVTDFGNTFGYGFFTEIPETLFKSCKEATNFRCTFEYCRLLTFIPSGLFDNNRKVTNFYNTFIHNEKLTGESPYSIIDGVKCHLYDRENYPDYFVPLLEYGGCFYGCPNLSDYESMPEDWK